ncbi:MAG: hypothetical protein F6K11_37170 [Leptolyngbya sp. SIO3F4]|nr:hypothetical protein [Leptolyngbya sp. SIO3F4]
MQIKIALSSALLGTIIVAIAGHAKTNSYDLSGTQAHTCPTLTGETTAVSFNKQAYTLPNDVDTNRLLAIVAFCNGYGYGGGGFVEADQITAESQSTTITNSDSFLYINNGQKLQTPQEAAKLDQLPQDRVEFLSPI